MTQDAKTNLAFDRIMIVMLENSCRQNVLNNAYMRGLLDKGVFLANSYAVTHPSQPNYILSIAGDTMGLVNNTAGYAAYVNYPQGWPELPIATSIVDLLEAKGRTWRCYTENLPPTYKDKINKDVTAIDGYLNSYINENLNTCPPYKHLIPSDEGLFGRRHVPFLSFRNIVCEPNRLAQIVDSSQLDIDLANGTLPDYSWYIPNMINDGHDLTPEQQAQNPYDPFSPDHPVNIENIAAFLQGFLGDDPIAKFPPKTLIVLTFDESFPYFWDFGIYTLLIGDMLEPGTVRTERYDHYSLLRTVEDNFALGTLERNDASATPYWFIP